MVIRRISAIGGVLLLCVNCAGTDMKLSGSACGQPFNLTMHDAKDRSGFEGSIKCSDGSEIHISSTDSSTSAVVNALSAAMTSLTTLVTNITAKITPGGATP